MKFKKMISCCKNNNLLVLGHSKEINESSPIYISDGAAIFVMPHFCQSLTAEDICNMNDIKESKQDKMEFKELGLDDYMTQDSYSSESLAKPTDIKIMINDVLLQPFVTESGMIYIKDMYIDICGISRDLLTFTERENKGIAIKKGMLLEGFIHRINVDREKTLEEIKNLGTLTEIFLQNLK